MKIISITGTNSGAGKTALVSFLIKALGGICALKITVHHQGYCPKEATCDGCSTIEDLPFKITTDLSALKEPDKDTARYLEAGASKVVWLQSYPKHTEEGIDQALKLFAKGATVLVEGNSFLNFKDADISIMVVSPWEEKFKPSAKKILDKIRLFVINKRPDTPEALLERARRQILSRGYSRLSATNFVRPRAINFVPPVIVFDPYHPSASGGRAAEALLRQVGEATKQQVRHKETKLVAEGAGG